jgi:hypothetical protein
MDGKRTEPSGNMGITVMALPPPRSGFTLEGPLDVACDPTAVEVALLGNDNLITDSAFVYLISVERDFTDQGFESGRRVFIRPRRAFNPLVAGD